MKKMITILGLLSMSLTAFASESQFVGNYSIPTVIRLFGYTKAECTAENGQFDESENSCTESTENTISVEENQLKQKIAKVAVIYRAADMRDFSGVVTRIQNNILTVREAAIDENGTVGNFIKDGCRLNIKIEDNKANLKLGKNCDSNLSLASGAMRK